MLCFSTPFLNTPRFLRYAFDYFDQDGTGQITLENLIKIFGSVQHASEVLGEEGVDLDGDSQISFEEFKSMMMSHDGSRQRTLHYTKRDPAYSERPQSKSESALKGAAEKK